MEKSKALIVLGIILGCSSTGLMGCALAAYEAGCLENRDRPAALIFVARILPGENGPAVAAKDSGSVARARTFRVAGQGTPKKSEGASAVPLPGVILRRGPDNVLASGLSTGNCYGVGLLGGHLDAAPGGQYPGVPLARHIDSKPDIRPQLITATAVRRDGGLEWVGYALMLTLDASVNARHLH